MKNKRVLIVYTYLFLFAFTFALSFTLASKAQAELDCCIYEWCYFYNPPEVTAWGHPVYNEELKINVCTFNGQHHCDFAETCPEMIATNR